MAAPNVIPMFPEGAPEGAPVASRGDTVLLRVTDRHYILSAPTYDSYPASWLPVNLPADRDWWTTCRPGPGFMLDCWAD